MSATLLVDCDRCGARIDRDRTLLKVTTGPLRKRLASVDLCPRCARAWESWLATREADR